MSTALAVYHGRFGRATLYHLDRPITTHAHREGHLLFQLGGQPCSVKINGAAHPLTLDCALAVNPWDPHSFHPGDPENGCLFLTLYIKPIWFLEVSRSAQSGMRFGRAEIEMTPQVVKRIGTVASILADGAGIGLFDGYLYELTRECYEQSWQWTPDPSQTMADTPRVNDFRVRKSMRLMAERPSADISLDTIARESGLSRPHFYKLFRSHTGITPNLFLNTLLMEQAIDHLTETDMSVTDIGYELGFPAQSGFTRFFSTNVGMAPTDYRRVTQILAG